MEKMGPGSGGGCGNYAAGIEGSCGKDGAWVIRLLYGMMRQVEAGCSMIRHAGSC